MSKETYIEIKNTLESMLEIEYDSSIETLDNVRFYIDDTNNKIIIKNYDSYIEFVDCMRAYFIVNDYEYIQQFRYMYNFYDCEIIEFDIEI